VQPLAYAVDYLVVLVVDVARIFRFFVFLQPPYANAKL
jgi:hypothetical protein